MIFGCEGGIILRNRAGINLLKLLVRSKYKLSRMGPKKNQEEEPILLGRFGTSLKVGIVGVPNVGYKNYICIFMSLSLQQVVYS